MEIEEFVKSNFYMLFKKELENAVNSCISESDLSNKLDILSFNIKQLDWMALSMNETLPWSVEFIELYKDYWDWHYLSYIIADNKFFNKVDFAFLLAVYAEKVDWKVLCRNVQIKYSDIIYRYRSHIDWPSLCSNPNFYWKIDFIKENIDMMDWIAFSESISTMPPFSNDIRDFRFRILEEFENYIDWSVISENEKINFDSDFIERYKDRFDWENIVNNSAMEWNLEKIVKYDKYLSKVPNEYLMASSMWYEIVKICVLNRL
ncbi:hypothetical protein SAMN05444405_12213 [Bacteroides luti]|uniref:Tryptophan repeat gene family protein n=1 Tax=Bacteroides luti TaxID=1297750 RepID=A0A1M5GS83_9BACE|nr:hypothetical protein [Bacteroides luti]SHG06575.1 hypothetical protein SAMN05444405_12213 [Bacteroides luti]